MHTRRFKYRSGDLLVAEGIKRRKRCFQSMAQETCVEISLVFHSNVRLGVRTYARSESLDGDSDLR